MALRTYPPYVIIAAPPDPSLEDTVDKLKFKIQTAKADAGDVFPINLPAFKVPTLDQLVSLSDEISKLEPFVDGVASKLADNLRNLLNNDLEQWRVNLTISDQSIDSFVKSFKWNTGKYRIENKTIKELMESVVSDVTSIDQAMKSKMSNYAQLKSTMQNIQRKQSGNLAVKSLIDIVHKEDMVLDSEYMQTLFVAIPKNLVQSWLNSYETLSELVVPRSSKFIAEDEEYELWSVTVFKKKLEEFSNSAREKKFIVREFVWDAVAIAKEKKQVAEIASSEREHWTVLLRLTKTNFGEVYTCYFHLKVLRVFIESILRYGLPADYQTMVVKARPKQEKKLRDLLKEHFSKLGGRAAEDGDEQIDDSLALLVGGKEYFPVVLFPINQIIN